MSEGEKVVSRAQFCAAQIIAWGKRAEHLRALLGDLHMGCLVADLERSGNAAHVPNAAITLRAVCTCGTDPKVVFSQEAIEAMQRAIALCDMEAEHWRARSRGAAGVRGES